MTIRNRTRCLGGKRSTEIYCKSMKTQKRIQVCKTRLIKWPAAKLGHLKWARKSLIMLVLLI